MYIKLCISVGTSPSQEKLTNRFLLAWTRTIPLWKYVFHVAGRPAGVLLLFVPVPLHAVGDGSREFSLAMLDTPVYPCPMEM